MAAKGSTVFVKAYTRSAPKKYSAKGAKTVVVKANNANEALGKLKAHLPNIKKSDVYKF